MRSFSFSSFDDDAAANADDDVATSVKSIVSFLELENSVLFSVP